MMTSERRMRRSSNPIRAITHQLAACCAEGIEAMVVADDYGLPLASAGDTYACEEVAWRMLKVGTRIATFQGVLLGNGQSWDIHMTKIEIEGNEFLVCAVGGNAEVRARQVQRGANGVKRILCAPTPLAA
jgi:hypothetical protein